MALFQDRNRDSGGFAFWVTNLIWQRASIKSFSLFAQPQAAWADAWNAIIPLLQSGIGLWWQFRLISSCGLLTTQQPRKDAIPPRRFSNPLFLLDP